MYVYRDKRFITPDFWGLPFWNYMFMYSKYSENSKTTPLNHFKTLSFFVACKKCRIHFRKKLEEDPPPRGEKELFKWIWKFKNEVNERQRKYLKKKKKDISLKKAKHNQSILTDSSVISIFYRKLIASMPILPRNHSFRHKTQYKADYVLQKLRKLIRDIEDTPGMSV